MPIECARQLLEHLFHDFRRGNVRWYHEQDAVTAIFGPHIRYALRGRVRHPCERLPDDETVWVGTHVRAERDYIRKDDGAVLAVQW